MAIIGNTGGTGCRSFARYDGTTSGVPFGMTSVTGTNLLFRSYNMNMQYYGATWWYTAPTIGTGGAVVRPMDGAGTVQGWIGSTGIFQARPDLNFTAGNTGGMSVIGGQDLTGVILGVGVTAIRFNKVQFGPGNPYLQGNDEFALFNSKTLLKAKRTDVVTGTQVYFRCKGTATWDNTSKYWQVPVEHVTGTFGIAGNPLSLLRCEFEFPSKNPWHETWDGAAGKGVRTWAGPPEYQALYIAHTMPATGTTAAIQQSNLGHNQKLPVGVLPGSFVPDGPSGGVGFWGIKSFTTGVDTRIGASLISYPEAFVALGNQCYQYTNGTYGTFSDVGQVLDWMGQYGFWSNYNGIGCDPDNTP